MVGAYMAAGLVGECEGKQIEWLSFNISFWFPCVSPGY